MSRLLIRPAAERDLDDIWWHIAQDSSVNADHFLDRIQDSCFVLADYPHLGLNRDEIRKGLRSHQVEHYQVFYVPLVDGVEIVRVLHGSRDIARNFFI